MPRRAPVPSQHLFVSPSGEALSRWLEAFPRAVLAKPKELRKGSESVKNSALVWLHLDQSLPCVDQLVAIKKKIGTTRVIVLASIPDNEDALALFSAGARGYCNAHATAANLKQVASAVQAGGLWIGEALMQRLVVATHGALSRKTLRQVPEKTPQSFSEKLHLLTARENEVAKTLANGASNKEIARMLGITDRTVKAHVSAIFQKLGARDRLHLALIINGHSPT
ncbi:MAG: response regulator transcription factor [Rhodocyclaceae bacterium]|nr:response regulator transcription factor [Rhodocyclaceae bacterium]